MSLLPLFVPCGTFPQRRRVLSFGKTIEHTITASLASPKKSVQLVFLGSIITFTGLNEVPCFALGDGIRSLIDVAGWLDDLELRILSGGASAAKRGIDNADNRISIPSTIILVLLRGVRNSSVEC